MFVTCKTLYQERILDNPTKMHLMQTLLEQTGQSYPFRLVAYVFLTDHIHLLLTPDPGITLDQIVHSMMKRFDRDYMTLLGMPGKARYWHRNYRRHRITDESDFATHLDYIHYNPVQHGLTTKPEGWPYSSYSQWLENQVYRLEWGWTPPKRIQGIQWE